MDILRNSAREKELFDIMRANFVEKERGGIKLSDLLYPRRAYWQKTHPLPPNDQEIQYWVVGRGHEDAVHRISGIEKQDSKVWNGIYYGIDFFIGHPIEMKTRRGYLAKEGEEKDRYESYLNQLIGYCACENMTEGELWVWSLMEKTDAFRSAPVFACYDVKFTGEEIYDEQYRLIKYKKLLMEALAGDVKVLEEFPSCPSWMCYSKETTIKDPPHCITCGKDFQTAWGLDKHKEGKKSLDHEVRYPTYNVVITPRCKWFNFCKGGEDGEEIQGHTDSNGS